ncbi:acyl-CoA thioesterase [Taibaiella koreensis]|uniref:acyl-CoA thioesterase n=1 Tax=Taibaiella koreensis TaxID=1268548 RepID=UPI000E59DB4D|nr:acyl-CoA thioesterase [Taibaiella koreensis]
MDKHPSSAYVIRFADCDPFGHLNNARYLDYFLHAREEHLEQAYQLNLADHYKKGLSWVVGGHQVSYLKPAAYRERVCISSMLIGADANSLLVEMMMTDAARAQLKSLLWTRFIPVDIQSGKRREHPADFMTFAHSITVAGIDVAAGYDHRLKAILASFKKELQQT